MPEPKPTPTAKPPLKIVYDPQAVTDSERESIVARLKESAKKA